MMVKTRTWMLASLAALCFATFLCPAALAEGAYASAYEWDNTLYASAYSPDATMNNAQIKNGTRIQYSVTPELISERKHPIEIMLLVDCSTSMPDYTPQMLSALETMTSELENYDITVASFGEKFQVKQTHLTDWASVRQAITSLSMREQATDICGGAVQAIQEAKDTIWESGEFAQIILLTDGEPYYSGDKSVEVEQEEIAAHLLESVLAESPHILLHSICFNVWVGTDISYHALTSGGGVHRIAIGKREADTAGKAIATFLNNLYVMEFPMESKYYSRDLTLIISSSASDNSDTQMIEIARSANLNLNTGLPLDPSIFPVISGREGTAFPRPDAPNEAQQSEEPTETAPPLDLPDGFSRIPGSEVGSDNNADDSGDNDSSGSSPGIEPDEVSGIRITEIEPDIVVDSQQEEQIPEGNDEQEAVVESDEENAESSTKFPALPIVAGTMTVIVVAGGFMWLRNSGRRKKLLIRAIIADGTSAETQETLYLGNEVFIGSDGKCSLILKDNSVAPRNTRIFRKEKSVFIEDLDSPYGTAIEGMRIFTPNLLRSNDVVLIGNVPVRFQFSE